VLALLIGLLLVAAVLGLFLDWRAAVVGIVSLPLSLGAAGLVLVLLGSTLNAMTTAGLILGIGVVVDDVVIGTDALLRRLRARRVDDVGRSSAEILAEVITEGRGAIVSAALIVALVVLPVVFVAGSAAAFLPQVALAYLLAVAASFVVALTVAPALTWLLVARRPGERRASRLGERLAAGYEAALAGIARRAGAARRGGRLRACRSWRRAAAGRRPGRPRSRSATSVRWVAPWRRRGAR
jgi:multidrug efflux pump subunit AcrB